MIRRWPGSSGFWTLGRGGEGVSWWVGLEVVLGGSEWGGMNSWQLRLDCKRGPGLQLDGFTLWLRKKAFVAGTREIPVLAGAGRVDEDVDRGDCS